MGCGFSCRREQWKDFRGHPIMRHYKAHRRLGAGAFSEVWRATHVPSGETHALKVVFWGNPDVKDHHKRILRKEVSVLKELQHKHIVGLIEDMEDPKHLIMALEYLKGGGLLEHLVEVEHYSEADAAQLFTQMLRAVQYMHAKHIMHRDIKPENVVFTERMSGKPASTTRPQVKLVDFGLARAYSSSRSVKARLGSPGFMAPETIEYERHAPAMDMYSLGVVLFVMLTGHKPMKSEEARQLTYSKYEANEYPKMDSWTWKRLSKAAQSLVLQLMERDPQKRVTAEQALKHKWIVTRGCSQSSDSDAVHAPVLLGSAAKEAAKLGRERRFKGLAQAIIAARRLSMAAGQSASTGPMRQRIRAIYTRFPYMQKRSTRSPRDSSARLDATESRARADSIRAARTSERHRLQTAVINEEGATARTRAHSLQQELLTQQPPASEGIGLAPPDDGSASLLTSVHMPAKESPLVGDTAVAEDGALPVGARASIQRASASLDEPALAQIST